MTKRALIVLLATLAVGCSITSATPSPSGQALTPWQQELYNLQPDGTRTLDSALKLTAMALGPIPGVNAQTAAVGEVDSATPGVLVVQQNLDQLTQEQRAAIEGYLTPDGEVQTVELGLATEPQSAGYPNALPLANVIVPAVYEDPFIQDIKDIAARASERAAEFFGTPPLYEGKPAVEIRVSSWDSPFMSMFSPLFEGGFHCSALVNYTSAKTDRHAAYRAIAIDVAHCYQAWVMGNDKGFDRLVPPWAWDGPSYYVALVTQHADDTDLVAWNRYLLQPDIPLFQRSYDAVGFYEQLAYMHVDLPAAMQAVLTDVDNPERFALAGATVNEFLDAWAPGISQLQPWPHDWHFVGSSMDPFIVDIKGPQQPMTVTNGSLEAVSQDAYSNHLFAVHSSADVVLFEFFGRARVGDGTVDAIIRDSAAFCTTDKGCQPCPDGSPPEIDVSRLSPDSVLAVGGGTDGTNGTVSGHTLDEFCKKTPKPTPPATAPPSPGGKCADGCASSAGDPHMSTLDGVLYDFQAAGEFVLLRSADGSFELQARLEPYPGTKNVTIGTAMAMRLAGHRLFFEPDPNEIALLARLDGLALNPATPTDLGGGVRIESGGGAYEITLGDGSTINLIGGASWGVSVFIDPSAELRQGGRGVLGSVPAGGAGIPALPDGTLIPATTDEHSFYQALYVTFADAWRVPDGQSLFDYEPGKSTASYTIHNYPREEDLVPLDDLTDAQRAAGEAACASIADPNLHRHCVYDVGITSDAGFGQLYEQTVNVLSGASVAPSGQQLRVVNLYSAPAGPSAVDVYSWTDAGAALVATVEYGTASGWFDPGSTDVAGQAQTKLSFQVHGQPVEPWGGNLYDPSSLAADGVHKTIVFATGSPDSANAPGGKQGVSYVELNEQVPAGYPGSALDAAPADAGLLFPDLSGLAYTHPAVSFFTSAGAGCLSMSLNPGQAGLNGVTGENGHSSTSGPLLVPPSSEQAFTLHEGSPADDPFSATCTSPPILGPLPLSLAAGQRAHAFIYAVPSDPTLRGLILPFGD